MSLFDSFRKAMRGEEKWALLYMMVKYEDGEYDGMHGCVPRKPIEGVWPEIHGFYDTEAEAYEMLRSKKSDGYFVRKMRNYTGSGI